MTNKRTKHETNSHFDKTNMLEKTLQDVIECLQLDRWRVAASQGFTHSAVVFVDRPACNHLFAIRRICLDIILNKPENKLIHDCV